MSASIKTQPKFKIQKKMLSGLLHGLVITEITSVEFEVGFRAGPANGFSDRYEIISVERIG